MIGWLRGTIRDRDATGRILVDVGGVGYSVLTPMSTFLELPREGEAVELFVDTQVREDSITLYGFRTAAERQVFERLLLVSGVGPRTALAALSGLGTEELASCIRNGDARRLATVPGIGKKTAERIVIDLRDRMGSLGGGASPSPRAAGADDDVVSALVNLGYPEKAAARAVSDCRARTRSAASFETLLRDALKSLGKG